jgi:penicillin-binding protein 1A
MYKGNKFMGFFSLEKAKIAVWLSCVLMGAALTGWLVWFHVGMPWLAALSAAVFAVFAALAGRPRLRMSRPTAFKRHFSFWRIVSLLVASVAIIGASALPFVSRAMLADVPRGVEEVLRYRPTISTRVFSDDGELICNLTLQNRELVPLDGIPPRVRNAFIAAEDQEFWNHHGVDFSAIVRAAIANAKGGGKKQGGSTLTQQVVKQLVLRTNEKSYIRKIREMFLAVKLERLADKRKILEVYLNQVFLGHGTYGVQSAAKGYFGKEVTELTLAEAAILAGLPKAPSWDSPYAHFNRSKERRDYVLDRMLALGYADEDEVAAARREEIFVVSREDPLNSTAAPYFCEHVRKELQRMYGYRAVYELGFLVYTTLDMRMQRAAESAVRLGLLDLERRLGWNGPEGFDENYRGCSGGSGTSDALVVSGRVASLDAKGISVCVNGRAYQLDADDFRRWAAWKSRNRDGLKVGSIVSVRLETRKAVDAKTKLELSHQVALSARRTAGKGHPEALQAGLLAVDPKTGALKAMVGGFDYTENQYNAATMSRRQTGSSVKPYVYLTALMKGRTVDEKVTDGHYCYSTASGTWCPRNYENKYYGTVDLRTALAKSLNSISVLLTAKCGVDEVIRTMRALGVSSPVPRVLPIAVGAAEISLWEHTYSYAGIASGGKRIPRHPDSKVTGWFFKRVIDNGGNTVYENRLTSLKDEPQAVPADDAYALTYLMKGVVEEGTGRRVRELRRPAGGKTGTTNDFRDVWFMGFTTDLVTGVWVGRMTPKPIAPKATGGGVALPIWLAFMKAAHPDTPARDFPVPPDINLVPVPNGQPVPFQRGRLPAKYRNGFGKTLDLDSPF